MIATKSPALITGPGITTGTIMSRKAAKQAKPTPRGRQGGRPRKHIAPQESCVEMTRITLRIRTDIAEIIHDDAEREGISQDEHVMRKCAPQIMALLDHYQAEALRLRKTENVKTD